MAAPAVEVQNWWAQVLRGIVAIAFGVVILVWPEFAVLTLRTLIVLFGLYALGDGIFGVVGALRADPQQTPRWSRLIEGVAGIVVGVLVLFWPGLTSLLLVYFIAGWAVVTGILKLVAAVRRADLLLIATGAVSILFGLLLIAIGGENVMAVVQLIAVFAIVYGFLLVLNGFQLRTQHLRST